MTKEEARRSAILRKLAQLESAPMPPPRAALPTGFTILDTALGGGLPRGSIVELFGPSCGKTTLMQQIVAHAQKSGAAAAWIDADHTFDPAYATELGVSVEDLPVAQPGSAEQALEIARQLVSSGAVDLIAVDSAAALVPALELEAGVGHAGPGLQSRVLASGLRRLTMATRKSGAVAVFLNQVRSRAGNADFDEESSAGGAPLKLYAAVRLELSPMGRRVRVRVLKNQAAGVFHAGELAWDSTPGFAKCP